MSTATPERTLSRAEKRRLVVLGLPTFALALSITVVSTYMPVIAKTFTGSTTVIGVLIGAEGLLALFVPLVVGTWSDQVPTMSGMNSASSPSAPIRSPIAIVELVKLFATTGR